MHSVFYRGTVEFRYFEGTLHAGKIKSYMQFCLALAAKAKIGKNAVARKRTHNASTAKYDFRVFLLRLGMIGDEFKSARLHLLGNMKGCASFKNGRPAKAKSDAPPAPEMAEPSSVGATAGHVLIAESYRLSGEAYVTFNGTRIAPIESLDVTIVNPDNAASPES